MRASLLPGYLPNSAAFRLALAVQTQSRLGKRLQARRSDRVAAALAMAELAAVDALLQWRFTPPLRHGRPVIARATQLFNFAERSR